MKPVLKISIVLLFIITFFSCRYITYIPRTKSQIQREKPSVFLLQRIVEYREEFNGWPLTKEEFIYKDKKYKEAFEGFPYLQTQFKLIDNDRMTFIFTQHKKDVQRYNETKVVDLNSYGGEVKFYKEKDKFIWKIKMY